MNVKSESRAWQAREEYRKRIRWYAWLLTLAVPGAYIRWGAAVDKELKCLLQGAWSPAVDKELQWLSQGAWSPAALLAFFAQVALIVGIAQAINLKIAFGGICSVPKPPTRKCRSRILDMIVGSFACVAVVVESSYLLWKVSPCWQAQLVALLLWLVAGVVLVCAVWPPCHTVSWWELVLFGVSVAVIVLLVIVLDAVVCHCVATWAWATLSPPEFLAAVVGTAATGAFLWARWESLKERKDC